MIGLCVLTGLLVALPCECKGPVFQSRNAVSPLRAGSDRQHRLGTGGVFGILLRQRPEQGKSGEADC